MTYVRLTSVAIRLGRQEGIDADHRSRYTVVATISTHPSPGKLLAYPWQTTMHKRRSVWLLPKTFTVCMRTSSLPSFKRSTSRPGLQLREPEELVG